MQPPSKHYHNTVIHKLLFNLQVSKLRRSIGWMQAESVAEDVKNAAEAAMTQTPFVYDAETGLYYDTCSGQYYDAVSTMIVRD